LYIVLPSLGSLGSDGMRLVEAMTSLGNKLRRPLLHLAGECSGANEGLLRHKLAGSRDLLAAPDLVGSSSPSGLALATLAFPMGFLGGMSTNAL
jgi:hypothetical protein